MKQLLCLRCENDIGNYVRKYILGRFEVWLLELRLIFAFYLL